MLLVTHYRAKRFFLQISPRVVFTVLTDWIATLVHVTVTRLLSFCLNCVSLLLTLAEETNVSISLGLHKG